MFNNKKILAVIPARGGSKGVPRKNIKMAAGKPLISWMIQAAKGSFYIDRLIVSSEDREIIDIAWEYGCDIPFVRPSELAGDDSSSVDVILHAIEQISGYDYVMLLQPTSPLTTTSDIDGCIEVCVNSNAPSTVSIAESVKSPHWMFGLDEHNRLSAVMGAEYLNCRRQDLPPSYIPTGAVYIVDTRWFLENKSFYSASTLGYIVPQERSLDIDSEMDFEFFRFLVNC